MATTEALTELLSESEHAKEPPKAVIASTVGTTIEWYDFLSQTGFVHALRFTDLK
jgi:hypothetical protein